MNSPVYLATDPVMQYSSMCFLSRPVTISWGQSVTMVNMFQERRHVLDQVRWQQPERQRRRDLLGQNLGPGHPVRQVVPGEGASLEISPNK